MMLSRRLLLLCTPAVALMPGLARADDPRLAARSLGTAAAPVLVVEYFSLTCPHCARFARDTFPDIKSKLIDAGRLRYGFADYPLDKVALLAAQVARALPPDRYWPFCDALLQSQDRWAFAQDVNSTEELAKMAALAGLSRAQFDAAVADDGLRDAILAKQDQDTKTFAIDSTPTFIFDGPKAHARKQSGEMTYDAFAKIVAEAGGATG